jgi:hypothetical protein
MSKDSQNGLYESPTAHVEISAGLPAGASWMTLLGVKLLIIATVVAWAVPEAHACPGPIDWKPLGLPVWATDPNEGSTWGAMPIVMGVCRDDSSTAWIFAPSATWNSIIHYTGTLRLYAYPDRESALSVIASVSSATNRNLYVVWQHAPQAALSWTDDAVLRVQRTVFARFFGIGSDTPADAESSYTQTRMLVTERRGINLGHHVNLGAVAGIERDGVDPVGVEGLPLAPVVFPTAPGMTGATVAWQGLDARYDDRVGGDYAAEGVRAQVTGSVVEGIARSPSFVRGGAQVNAVWPELDWLGGAARALWTGESSRAAPFYQQSSLGGAFLMRGFAEGRFVDREAWTVELEQRIRLLRTHIFGVTADWRADPFITAGQVFDTPATAFDRPQVAAGVGLRAFVSPNVVGRVDLADGGEGLKIYVEIGYPY